MASVLSETAAAGEHLMFYRFGDLDVAKTLALREFDWRARRVETALRMETV